MYSLPVGVRASNVPIRFEANFASGAEATYCSNGKRYDAETGCSDFFVGAIFHFHSLSDLLSDLMVVIRLVKFSVLVVPG